MQNLNRLKSEKFSICNFQFLQALNFGQKFDPQFFSKKIFEHMFVGKNPILRFQIQYFDEVWGHDIKNFKELFDHSVKYLDKRFHIHNWQLFPAIRNTFRATILIIISSANLFSKKNSKFDHFSKPPKNGYFFNKWIIVSTIN